MNTTTRNLIAIPLAAAALSAGTTTAMAQPAGPVLSDLDISQPEPQPEPHPQPDPNPEGPGDIGVPDDGPGPDGPDDLDNPAGGGPDGPDDLDGPNPGDDDDDDGDNDDGDSDDGDNDDGDSDDSDDDDSDDKVRRPSRVDAGASEDGLSLAWLLASGAMVTAAGGFTARRAAMKRR